MKNKHSTFDVGRSMFVFQNNLARMGQVPVPAPAKYFMKNTIKKFVKETLGCNCPDEVFEHIEFERDVPMGSDIVLDVKINIGNRLLVYVLKVSDSAFLGNKLNAVTSSGKEERDKKGFNRFRLVLAGKKDEGFEQTAHVLFDGLKDKDDRVHLHIVENVPWGK